MHPHDAHGEKGSKRQRPEMAPFATSPKDHGRGCGNGKAYDDHDARHPGTQPQDTHELDIPKPNGIACNQSRERE